MISHYALYDTSDLTDRFQLPDGLPKGVKPHYNYSPTVSAPVILSADGNPTLQRMNWGLLAKGAKDTNSVFRYKTYNVASENIFSRHSWEQAVRERRCLVPANGFYDLNGSGAKRAYFVQPKDEGLFAFAGIYSSWKDEDGVTRGTFSIITIDANPDMPTLSGRMPVIIRREDEARWLDASISDMASLYDMLRAYPTDQLSGREVSAAVHSPKPNSSDLLTRI